MKGDRSLEAKKDPKLRQRLRNRGNGGSVDWMIKK